MSRVCPKCHFESPVDSPFCPACGAAMDGEAQEKRLRNEYSNAAVLPMKWHKFLIYVSLPLSMVLSAVELLRGFELDLGQASGEIAFWARAWATLSMVTLVLQLFLALFTEVNLVRLRWRGVTALLGLYGLEAVYALLTVYVLFRAGASVPMDIYFSVLETVAMLFINRLYYRKRKPLFTEP